MRLVHHSGLSLALANSTRIERAGADPQPGPSGPVPTSPVSPSSSPLVPLIATGRQNHALEMQRSVRAVHAGGSSDAGGGVIAAGAGLVSGRTGTAPANALADLGALRDLSWSDPKIGAAISAAQRNLQRTDYAIGLLLHLKSEHGKTLPAGSFTPRLHMELNALVQSLAVLFDRVRTQLHHMAAERPVIATACASARAAVDDLIRQARRFDPGFVPDDAIGVALRQRLVLPD